MKPLTIICLISLSFVACQDGELPAHESAEDEVFDTRCTSSYISGNLTGQINSAFDANSNQDGTFVSYSTPTGIYAIGEQNGIKLTIGINWYNGPGDYKISTNNHITITENLADETILTYVSKAGTINMREFRSPKDEVCLRGVFSFDASSLEGEMTEAVSMINGAFEMTLP